MPNSPNGAPYESLPWGLVPPAVARRQGWATRATTGAPEFAIPWGNLGVTALVVPLLAVLAATVFTPSRLPLMRRVT